MNETNKMGSYREGNAVLRAEGLVKRYGKRTVVNDVSINVKQGEIVGLLGPNGAGKTLIARYIAGGIAIGEGSIERRRADGSVMALNDVMTLEFKDLYRIGGAGQDDYYQKRWHATETEGILPGSTTPQLIASAPESSVPVITGVPSDNPVSFAASLVMYPAMSALSWIFAS